MNYSLSKIRTESTYSIKEISDLFGIDRKTVFRWLNEGLILLDAKKMPHLIMGQDLKDFLREKREAKEVELKLNEFYCLKCKKSVEAQENTINIKKTGKKIGRNNVDQERLSATCKECGREVSRLLPTAA